MVSPEPFSPTPTSSAMKTLENAAQDPHDPEQEDEGDTQTEYYSDQLYNLNGILLWSVVQPKRNTTMISCTTQT